jgi:aspartate carbamoyltransferase catalytic subunit
LTESGVEWEECDDLQEVASAVDVVYQTRIQRERFGDRVEDYAKARGKYIVDKRIMDSMKNDSIVMHPLPRLDEVSRNVWLRVSCSCGSWSGLGPNRSCLVDAASSLGR